MRRIVILASSRDGVLAASRLKRLAPGLEVNLVLPAGLPEPRKSPDHALLDSAVPLPEPVRAIFSGHWPDKALLEAGDVFVLEAESLELDLSESRLTVESGRGSLPVRFTELAVEADALPRIPRHLRNFTNLAGWPAPPLPSNPGDYDVPLRACATDSPAVIVGHGLEALKAIGLAINAGVECVWLRTAAPEPALAPEVWDFALKALADLPGLRILDWQNAEPGHLAGRAAPNAPERLAGLENPDGRAQDGYFFIWTAPLLVQHPLLREEGVNLNDQGLVAVDKNFQTGRRGVYMFGSGVSRISDGRIEGPISERDGQARALALAMAGADPGEPWNFGLEYVELPGLAVFQAGFRPAVPLDPEPEEVQSCPPDYLLGYFLQREVYGEVLIYALAEKSTRRLAGFQILAGGAAGDLAAACADLLLRGGSVDELSLAPFCGRAGALARRIGGLLRNKLDGAERGIQGVTPRELMASQRAGAEFFILDLRSLAEWRQGRLPGAYNIPLPELKTRLQREVPRQTPLVLTAEDSGPAWIAARKLAGLGATDVYVLDGGMALWPFELEK